MNNNIKKDYNDLGWKGMDRAWFRIGTGGGGLWMRQWTRGLHKMREISSTSWEHVSFSWKTMLHGASTFGGPASPTGPLRGGFCGRPYQDSWFRTLRSKTFNVFYTIFFQKPSPWLVGHGAKVPSYKAMAYSNPPSGKNFMSYGNSIIPGGWGVVD